jgi:hypothetical protein
MGLGETERAFKASLKEGGLFVVEVPAIGEIVQNGLKHWRNLGGDSDGRASSFEGDISSGPSERARDRFPGEKEVVLVILAGGKNIGGFPLENIPRDGREVVASKSEKDLVRPVAEYVEISAVADTGKGKRLTSVFADLAMGCAGNLGIQLAETGQVRANRFAAVLVDVNKTAKGDNGLAAKLAIPESFNALLKEFEAQTTGDEVFAVDLTDSVRKEGPGIELGRLGGVFGHGQLEDIQKVFGEELGLGGGDEDVTGMDTVVLP